MIQIYIQERNNMEGPNIAKLEFEALSIKWLIEYTDIFIKKTKYEGPNEEFYYLDQRDFFRLLKEVRSMEKKAKFNLQLSTSEHDFEDIQEMSELRKYLMKLAIEPSFNWNDYTLMARVEALSFFDLEYSELDIF